MSKTCQEVLATSFDNDKTGLQAFSHSFVDDLGVWHKQLIKTRPEAPLFAAAMSEYQFSLLAVVQGQYRQAFMALRLSLELLLGCVFLSANEFELRSWLRGERDLFWTEIISAESGVLSKRFTKVFFEALKEEAPHYRSMAEKAYRECSEYVHGNAQTSLRAKLAFQETAFRNWHDKAKTVRLISSFALCSRYIDLTGSATRNNLEHILMENLGHLPAVRAKFGAVVEVTDA